MSRKMPKQRPGKSEQTVCTPREFLDAVERRFGRICYDLACTSENAVGSPLFPFPEYDSLAESSVWARGFVGYVRMRPLHWLNPPYANIGAWAEKAAASGANIAMLVPASVGSNWFAQHVHGKAYVLALSPRLKFVGHPDPYPKDLMLCLYGMGLHGFDTWRWDR